MKWNWMEVETEHGCFRTADTALQQEDVSVFLQDQTLYLTAGQTPVETLRLGISRQFSPDALFYADHWGRGMGDLAWLPAGQQRAVMPWYFLVSEEGRNYGWGVKVNPNAICSWQYDGNTIILTADVRNGTEGVCLNGRTLEVCTAISAESEEDTHAFAHGFCLQMAGTLPPLPTEPIYGGNDWYCCYGNNSAAIILEHARKLAECAQGNPVRPFMVVDDGWQLCRNLSALPGIFYGGGPWQHCNSRFGDMRQLAEQIRALDVRPGLWFRPLLDLSYMPEECYLPSKNGKTRALDASHPLVLQKVAEDVSVMRGWGFELFKHDYTLFDTCGVFEHGMTESVTPMPFHFYDRTKTTAEILKTLYRTIKEAADGALVIGCNVLGHLGVGAFDLQRVGGDTSGIDWNQTVRMGVNSLAFRMMHDKAFYLSDGDCVGITKDIPWEKNRQWLELLAYSGTPLFVSISEDGCYGPQQRADITEAFRVAASGGNFAKPMDWMETPRPEHWLCKDGIHHFRWEPEAQVTVSEEIAAFTN